jgi:hypothetical protein
MKLALMCLMLLLMVGSAVPVSVAEDVKETSSKIEAEMNTGMKIVDSSDANMQDNAHADED